MCKLCADAMSKYWPDLTIEQQNLLLWEATPHPFADGEYMADIIRKLAEVSNSNLDKAIAFANSEMERDMSNVRK
jgi:hypothetical protein